MPAPALAGAWPDRASIVFVQRHRLAAERDGGVHVSRSRSSRCWFPPTTTVPQSPLESWHRAQDRRDGAWMLSLQTSQTVPARLRASGQGPLQEKDREETAS